MMPGKSLVDPDNQNDHSLSEMEAMAPPPQNTYTPGSIESTLPSSAPGMQGATAMGMTAPPESRFKRRGTGVPTAEEIAEQQAAAGITGRIRAITSGLRGAGATPEMQQRAIMGIAGAPMPLTRPQNVAGVMAVLPDGRKVPVSRDADGNLLDDQGQPLPEGTTYERSAGGAGAVTSTIKDSPEIRAQYGIDPSMPNPSGYWRIRTDGAGNSIVQAAEFTPPPAYSGTGTFDDPNSPTGRTVRGINRGGGVGGDLGNAPAPTGEPSEQQAVANALLKAIEQEAKAFVTNSSPVSTMRKQPTAAQMDEITRRLATQYGQPYTRYVDVQRATQGTTVGGGAAPATGAQGQGSVADRVRARILAEQGGGAAAAAPDAPPQRPPSRVGGPAPARPARP